MTTSADRLAEDTLGHVIWHSSEEDGAPDVGLSLGLGDGRLLYLVQALRAI